MCKNARDEIVDIVPAEHETKVKYYAPYEDPLKNSPFISTAFDEIVKSPLVLLYHIVFGPPLVIIRFTLWLLGIMILWIIAKVIVDKGRINPEAPFISDRKSWRYYIRSTVYRQLYRWWLFLAYGVVKVEFEGTPDYECPVTVAAPHTTMYFDVLPILRRQNMSLLASFYLSTPILIGTLATMAEPIFVDRAKSDSRKKALELMEQRVKTWPGGILVFPEGNISNGRAIAKFREGAFLFGTSVQPVVLEINRFWNFHTRTATWTATGPQDVWCNILQFCQPWQTIKVKFLPTYKPSETEKANPELFAQNVASVIAEAARVTATDFSAADKMAITEAVMENRYAHKTGMLGLEELKHITGLRTTLLYKTAFKDFIRMANTKYKRSPGFLDSLYGDQSLLPVISIADMHTFYEIEPQGKAWQVHGDSINSREFCWTFAEELVRIRQKAADAGHEESEFLEDIWSNPIRLENAIMSR